MSSPLPLPDWVPWWVHLAILLLGLFFGLMLLLMPFGVFGLKGRLEAVEARLDEIQGEIRHLALRLPEPVPEQEAGLLYAARPPSRPPIPPAPHAGYPVAFPPPAPVPAPVQPAASPARWGGPSGRTEPRLF